MSQPPLPLKTKTVISSAMDRGNELLIGARKIPYKVIGEHTLNLFVFDPANRDDSRPASVMLFFFGGKWDQSLTGQFATHCMHFASRGAVSIVVDYRVSIAHGTGPLEAMADARTAFRWVRRNAAYLGADPARIVGFGASSGAHLVASSAMIANEIFDDYADDKSVSCAPDAMVLFSPAVEISAGGFGFELFPDKKTARAASPHAHIRKRLPPAMIVQGVADRVINHDSVARFARLYKKKKNVCEFLGYAGEGHGFNNFNVNFRHYESTLISADRFLVDLEFLEPNPEGDEIPRLSTYIG